MLSFYVMSPLIFSVSNVERDPTGNQQQNNHQKNVSLTTPTNLEEKKNFRDQKDVLQN